MEKRYKIIMDLKNKLTHNIKFKEGDVNSSILDITLIDNGQIVDVTGQSIEFNFLKTDDVRVIQDANSGVSIINALQGNFQCVLNSDTLTSPGAVDCEISFKKQGRTLTVSTFEFRVESSIM